jgi:hypothetical protein
LLRPVEAQLNSIKKVAGKAMMFFRISATAVVVSVILATSAQAQIQQIQVRSPMKLPDPRGEFVRLCAPHMIGRWAHPESVCSCLHDYAAAAVEDADLRGALLRGISDTGVPTIETEWVPPSKQSEIGATFTKIAKPTLQCMFEPLN